MNLLDRILQRTPDSTDSWHCPWFRLIEFFAGNGAIFGMTSFLIYDEALGLVASGLGLVAASLTLGSRSREESSC